MSKLYKSGSLKRKQKKHKLLSTAEHDPKQLKLLFVEAPMVSHDDSIADSHSQRESETITTMSCSHGESSGTQQFLKDTMESSDSEYEKYNI